jgi:hypothetical protein
MATIHLIDGTAGHRAPVKAAKGKACNRCGFCCAADPCGVAREFIPDHSKEGPCLVLEWKAGRFSCGIIRRPSHYMWLPNDWADGTLGGMIAEALGAGLGCDADL